MDEAVTLATGFSPGLAVRLRLGDRRRVFVKAVGPEPNPDSPGIHRSKAPHHGRPARLGPAPRLLWSLDRRGWVALVFEDVDGAHPTLPPGLPTLRAFQLGQGVVALDWLRRRTGWA